MASVLIAVFDGVLLNGPAVVDDITVGEFHGVGGDIAGGPRTMNVNDAVTVAESAGGSLLADSPFRQGHIVSGAQITLPMAVVARNTLAVFIRWSSAVFTLDSVTDSLGNTYELVQNPITVGSGVRAAAAVAADIVAGSATIFANFSQAPAGVWMAAHEVTQRDLLAPVDGSAGQAQSFPSGTDGISAGPFTTNRVNAYIFGGTTDGLAGVQPGTGFLLRTADVVTHVAGGFGEVGFMTEDKVQASPGTVAVTFTPTTVAAAFATIGVALQYARAWLPSLTETVTIAESHTVSVKLMPVLAETVTVTEVVTLQSNPGNYEVFDAVTVTESVAMNIASFPGLTISVSDLVLLEAQAPPVIVAVETLAVTDLVLLAIRGIAAADQVTVTENLTVRVSIRINAFDVVLLVIMAEAFEPVTVTESVTLNFVTFGSRQITVNDAVVLTESHTVRFSRLPASVSDDVTVTEASPVRITPLRVSASDATTLTDQPTAALLTNVGAVAFDAVTVTENQQVVFVAAGARVITVSDSVTVEDVSTLFGAPNATAFDAVTVAESVSAAVAQLKVSVTDDVTLADVVSLTVQSLGGVSVADLVTVAEGVTLQLSQLQIQVFDDVSAGEGRDLAENPMVCAVHDLVAVSDVGAPLVGERRPTPRIRATHAWERWIRRPE